jgi:hypothetical protein
LENSIVFCMACWQDEADTSRLRDRGAQWIHIGGIDMRQVRS